MRFCIDSSTFYNSPICYHPSFPINSLSAINLAHVECSKILEMFSNKTYQIHRLLWFSKISGFYYLPVYPFTMHMEMHTESSEEEKHGLFLSVADPPEATDSEDDDMIDNSASIKNPNRDDPRRLFQVYDPEFKWDSSIPYVDLPIPLEERGPTDLIFPDHFYEVMGAVVIIYWEKEPSAPIMASILRVDEVKKSFSFQIFGTQGKKRNTYFDTGKTVEAKESLVWRLVHRKDFECERKPDDIRTGQMIRVLLQNEISDSTGLVLNVSDGTVTMKYTSGIYENRTAKFHRSQVAIVEEIMTSPLFYNLKKLFHGGDLVWEKAEAPVSVEPMEVKQPLVAPVNELIMGEENKPRMLLHAPANCKNKRLWHFLQLFPVRELEYCTDIALQNSFGEGKYIRFDAIAYFAAWFTLRRLHLSERRAYRQDLDWANQTRFGIAVAKLPRELYSAWHKNICGYLPIDRDFFMVSLVAARDREYAVCRTKPLLLRNSRNSREAPPYVVTDEQIDPYYGSKSGLKKRKAKKRRWNRIHCSSYD